jgi:hypothetical protein
MDWPLSAEERRGLTGKEGEGRGEESGVSWWCSWRFGIGHEMT